MNRIDIGRRGTVFPAVLLTMVALLVAGSIMFAATPADATDDMVTVTTYDELKKALDDGHNVGLKTGTKLEGDVQFIRQGQYIYLESLAKYKGTVTYDQNSIAFGGKDGSEVRIDDYIVANTDCYITAGEPLEIKGTFRGADNQENRFIKITEGSVKATGGIENIRLEVFEKSTLIIEQKSDEYVIDANSLLDISGSTIIKEKVTNIGSINIGSTGKFDVKGTLVNLGSVNIDNGGSITVDVDGTVSNEKYGDHAPTITNKGTLINNGTISIMFGTLDVSAGSTQNNKILTINGTIIGDDTNPVKNASKIELNGESTNLMVENIKDGAEVDIKSVLCKTLTVSNSIGDADTSDSTIRIEAEHFALEGLRIVSKIRDSARYNDMSGIVSTDQKSPLDHNTDRDHIECVSVHADGHVSIDGELSLPKGVTLRVGYDSDHTVFTIDGTFVTDAGQITADVYKDESKTDTESVTGLYEAGGLYLKNTEITIIGKYTAKAISLCNNRGNVFNFASYAIDDVSNYTSLSKAIDECSKSGRDCQIWSYDVTIDDDMLIPDNITLNAMKSITVKEGKTLTVNGKLMLTPGMVDGEIATNRSSMDDVVINGGGSVTVLNGAVLTAKAIKIFGSLSSNGSVVAEHIFVGTSDEILRPYPATLGAISSVSGQVSATGYWVVATGYDVSGVNLEGCVSTSYVVEDAPHVTLYAVSPTCIGIVTTTDQEENKWVGWYAEGGSMTDVSNDSVGDHDTVCAMYEDDIVSEDNGITAKDCLTAVLVAIVAVTAIALIAHTMRN